MSTPQLSSQGADVTLSNRTATTAHDALTVRVLVNGQPRYLWTPVDLQPGSGWSVSIRFLVPVTDPVIVPCGDHPVGIVDQPDPVVTVNRTRTAS